MVKKIHSKTEITIEADSFEIVACKDPQLQSFLNVFHLEGETPAQQKVGEVFGVIQVQDHSEQSAYLPNLIAQVIKKEFFKNSKRSIEDSFEAALHKANSALAELAQHELVEWHGKLDAAIGAISGEHLFFTQTNNGKIFLIREKKIVEISKGLDEPAENPLKTFSDVSSGEMSKDDKLVFSTPTIHDSLSLDDLKRHVNTFSSDEFDNLLKSTLETEGENAGVLIVNFSKKTHSALPKPKKKKKDVENYFGEKAQKKSEKKEPVEDDKNDKNKEKKPTDKELAEKTRAIINKKSANKEEPENTKQGDNKNLSPFEQQPELFIKEGDKIDIDEKHGTAMESIKEKLPFLNEKDKKGPVWEEEEKETKDKKREAPPVKKDVIEKKEKLKEPARPERKEKEPEKKAPAAKNKKTEELSSEIPPLKKKDRQKKVPLSSTSFFEGSEKSKKVPQKKPIEKIGEEDQTGAKLKDFWQKDQRKTIIYKEKFKKLIPKKESVSAGAGKLLERAKKATGVLGVKKLDISTLKSKRPSTKMLALVAVFLIILVGTLYVFFTFRGRYERIENEEVLNEEERDGNSVLVESTNEAIKKVVDLESDIDSMAMDDGSIFLLTPLNSFYRYETRNGTLEEISVGEHIKNAHSVGAIDNLNLILLVSNEKVMNYNRVVKSFDENKVDLPDDLDVVAVDSYLSYFYILDKNSGQIYRYSRNTDKPVEWLNETIDTSNATDMAIDDSVRIVFSDGTIAKYFKNKQEDSFLLDHEPKITPDKITTAIDHDHYYILDSNQGLIAIVSKDGNEVKKTFKDGSLSGAKDILFDKENNKLYFVTSDSQLMEISL